MTRRKLVLLVVLALVAACTPGGSDATTSTTAPDDGGTTTTPDDGGTTTAPLTPTTPGPAADGDTIRIGFLAPTSSVAAESAQDMVDGWNMFWDEHGLSIGDRPVEIFIEDDTGDPAVALSKARLLVEQRNVHMLVGLLFANTGYAVADYAEESGIPTFYPVVASDDLTQRQRVPNVIRVAGNSSSQETHAFGEWVATETDCENLYTVASDYAYGYEVTGGLVNTFTDEGGQLVGQIWNPIGETDFSSYLATIQSAQPDCVFAIQVGASSLRFLEAWRDFGLKDQIPLYLGEDVLDQSILRGIDDPELVEGLIGVGRYAGGWDDPTNVEYQQAFEERYEKLSSYFAAASYEAGHWVAEALQAVDGNVDNVEAFLEAVRQVELDETAMGSMRLDEYGNPLIDVFIRSPEMRDDGRLWNVPVEILEDVSQFGTYEPEAFLQQPVYSRDYQGVDWP